MTCPKPDRLSRYADGASPRTESGELERHLADCSACTTLIDQERELARAFAVLPCPDPEALAAFIDDLLPRVQLERIAAHVLACTPCQDVVTWTREGLQQLDAAPTRRRRRGTVRRRESTPAWAPAAIAAVAAACLLLALLLQSKQPTGQQARVSPAPSPAQPNPTQPSTPVASATARPSDSASPSPSQATPSPSAERPTPAPSPSAEPPSPSPSSATPSPSAERPTPAPSSTQREIQPEPTPTADPIQVAALDGSLDWSHGQEKGTLGLEPAQLPAGACLEPRRGQASLRLGDASLHVQGVLALVSNDRAELLEGQAFVEAPSPRLELACGEGRVRATSSGARFAIAVEPGGRVFLSVLDGEAEVFAAAGRKRVSAGQGAKLGRGGWSATPLSDSQRRAVRERALNADLTVGLDAPRGLLAYQALTQAREELKQSDLARRARATHAVLALAAAEPRLARLANDDVPAARAALEALLALDDATLIDAGAAGSTARALLAAASRFGGRKPDLDAPAKARLQALASALAADPQRLVTDLDGLLAARAAAAATRFKLPRLPRPRAGGLDASARAALAGARLSSGAQEAEVAKLQALLDRDPLQDGLSASDLLSIQSSLSVLGQLTPAREARLLAHGWLAAAGPELALLVSQDVLRAAGRQPVDRGLGSVIARRQGDAWRVTFRLRSDRKPQRMFLATSFNGWSETELELERRPDGTFLTTVVLAPGRHEYKLVLAAGQTWETDPGNPLTGPSNVDQTLNSVLILPE